MNEIEELCECPNCGFVFSPMYYDDEKEWCHYCDDGYAPYRKYKIVEVEDAE
jgi:hypothetical protein